MAHHTFEYEQAPKGVGSGSKSESVILGAFRPRIRQRAGAALVSLVFLATFIPAVAAEAAPVTINLPPVGSGMTYCNELNDTFTVRPWVKANPGEWASVRMRIVQTSSGYIFENGILVYKAVPASGVVRYTSPWSSGYVSGPSSLHQTTFTRTLLSYGNLWQVQAQGAVLRNGQWLYTGWLALNNHDNFSSVNDFLSGKYGCWL